MKNNINTIDQTNLAKVKVFLNKLGPVLMLPISLVAFSSIVLGVSFMLPTTWLLTKFMQSVSSVIFTSFPILVYLSMIHHFHNDKNQTTMINGVIVLMMFIGVQSAIVAQGWIPELFVSHLGYNQSYGATGTLTAMTPISLSVFSMMVLALIYIYIDNKLTHKELHYLMSVGLIILLTPIFMLITLMIWSIGFFATLLPFGFGAFVYGLVNRLLIPFGLHSTLLPTFLFSEAGGVLKIYSESGELINTVAGDSSIWVYMYTNGMDFTELTGYYDSGALWYEVTNSYNVGQYQQGFLPMLTFAFPMLGLTYIMYAGWEEGKTFLFITIGTAMTGITEMTEFTFIFISPVLYITNALLFAASFFLLNVLDVSVWISTGWSIDIIMFGIIPSLKGFSTHWYWIPVVGISLGAVYSAIYYWLLSKDKISIAI